MEELRFFMLKGVSNELQNPAKNKKSRSIDPERMKEDGGNGRRNREHDQWNAKAMAEPIDRMSVTAGVFRDPLLVGASAWHEADYIPCGLLWRQQEDSRRSSVNVAIRIHFMMLADQRVLEAKGNDLPFIIDGESSNQHYVTRQGGNHIIQVKHSALLGPHKGAHAQRAAGLPHHLPLIIYRERLAVGAIRG